MPAVTLSGYHIKISSLDLSRLYRDQADDVFVISTFLLQKSQYLLIPKVLRVLSLVPEWLLLPMSKRLTLLPTGCGSHTTATRQQVAMLLCIEQDILSLSLYITQKMITLIAV